MIRSVIQYHKQLISSNSRTSSARYMALGAFYVSSWIMVYMAIKSPELFVQVFFAYIGTFTAGYIGGKAVAAIGRTANKDVKG